MCEIDLQKSFELYEFVGNKMPDNPEIYKWVNILYYSNSQIDDFMKNIYKNEEMTDFKNTLFLYINWKYY